MGERDAFGNEKGEKSALAGLGWTTGGAPSASEPVTVPPPAAPAPAPTPAPTVSVGAGPAAPPPTSPPSETGFRSGSDPFGAMPTLPPPAPRATPPAGIPRYQPSAGTRLLRLGMMTAVPLIIFGAIGATIFSIGNDVSDRVGDVRHAISTSLDQITVPTVPPVETPATPATPPVGFGKGSLLVKSNFADALRTLRGEGSRVKSLRVAPDRIDAQLVTLDGRLKSVQITWQGEIRRSSTGPGFPTTGTFSVDAIQRAAPFRLARSAAGRERKSPSSIDYVVGLELAGRQVWTVLFKDRRAQYLADGAGRITSKNG
jgi:hypothetical protein